MLLNWKKCQKISKAKLLIQGNREEVKEKIIKEVETLTKDKLWKENEWIADYRRLRVVAHI